MNFAMKTTLGDLSGLLQKSLGSTFETRMLSAAENAASRIVAGNRHKFVGLESAVIKTGPLSWSVSFQAPALWAGTFGTPSRNEQVFDTHYRGDA